MTNNNKQLYIDFEAYERLAEPHKRERASLWRTAIGLQDVDGLKVSDYLKEAAVKHIEGDITIDDVRQQLKSYYVNKTTHDNDDAEKEEADRVAANIAKLLSEQSFSFTALEFLNIHRHLFDGVFKHAGEIRPYDISKKEWVLQGDTVVYGRAADIMMALRYDIQQEKDFCYKGLTTDEIINHIVDFVTLLWQNHPFREGNTRTTAVFVIKYLRSIGFRANNDLFAENSWYFRNALVRANYRNPSKGVEPNKSFLVKFFRNLMLGEQHELKNRYMLIGYNDTDNTHTSTHTSTRTSTSTSTNNLKAGLTENVKRLILAIGTEEKSVKEMMEAIGLKNRPNFLEYSLTPAISDGFVTMKYPSSPRHPRQKYLLTVKGLAVYDKMSS
ncbi:Fic family protein [Prevotella sp.]|uniref:Fic family protein n=2 Tax=Prevotella TaxID=838 RepID=UPI0025CC7A01|nr:Fic family protein [Prevotella sp.]MCI6130228.1 Fic family protein [Prevotella sp.]